jgi:hypothetical protein
MPGGQSFAHLPALHAACPPAIAGHTFPQAPQLSGSEAVSVQTAPHAVQPVAHEVPHVPFVHVGTTSPLLGQTFAHDPQNCGSLVRSTQLPLQLVSGGAHVAEQPVGVHTCPAPHTTPHAPQLVNDRRSASQPLETMPSQSAKSGSHSRIAHFPALHVGIAFAVVHAHVDGSPHPISGPALAFA